MLLLSLLKWRNCLSVVALSVLSACAASPAPTAVSQPVNFSSCESLVGDFDAYGTDEATGKFVSYKAASRLPKSDAAHVLSLSFDRSNQRLLIQQLSSGGTEVSVAQRLPGDCVAGHWVLRHPYRGGGDGARVEGVDVFDFHRSSDGGLSFRLSREGTITPFLASRPYRDDSAARFAPIKR